MATRAIEGNRSITAPRGIRAAIKRATGAAPASAAKCTTASVVYGVSFLLIGAGWLKAVSEFSR